VPILLVRNLHSRLVIEEGSIAVENQKHPSGSDNDRHYAATQQRDVPGGRHRNASN
jgi:hypothetical protein